MREMLGRLQIQANGINVLKLEAIEWMKKAELFLNEVNTEELEKGINARCMDGFFPSCPQQCASGVLIEQHIRKIDQLIEENKQIRLRPVVKGSKRACSDIVMRTRADDINKIWECLSQRHDVNVICLHGIAGVGKTAIAEAIYSQALEDEQGTFDYVIWMAAEYGIELRSLHEKIARNLNIISLQDTDDDADRAAKIKEELVQRKKCLMILDFLWEDFSLEEIGIPETTDHKNVICKVVLTSRSQSTCPKILKNELFEIKPLSKDDTGVFFERNFPISLSSMDEETRNLVKKAVEDCEGLPYAVRMLATYLREVSGQRTGEISSALKEKLNGHAKSTSSMKMMFKCLEYSYDRLDKRSQQCFVHCTLYPKGYSIEAQDLIDYWAWEGLLDNYIRSTEERRRLGMEVLRKLKDARLLETFYSDSSKELLKMPGLIHDMAVNIIEREGSGLFSRAGNNLSDFPLLDDRQGEIQRASFMQNQLRALKKKPNCPNLSTLLLQNNPLDQFSPEFFSQIPNLRFLDLSYTHIYFLPPEACSLRHLHVLLLRHCPSLKHLPSLSKLEQLIVLDLFGTPLEELPTGMEKLKKLEHLDLSDTKLTKFPAGLISAWPCLREFLMIMKNAKGYSWRSHQNISSSSKEAHVEELARADTLTALELNFFDIKALIAYMRAIIRTKQLPSSFKFCVGGFYMNGHLGQNSIALIDDYRIDELPKGTLELYLTMYNQSRLETVQETGINFHNLKVLDVSNYGGLTYLFSTDMMHCLHSLEQVFVRQCWSMKGIIKPTADSSDDDSPTMLPCSLPRLQELVLIDLPNLKRIDSEEQQQVLIWSAFRRLCVWNCESLNKLPHIVGEDTEPRMIEVVGKSFWFKNLKLDDSCPVNFEFEDADVPEDMISFVRYVILKVKSSSHLCP